MKMVQTKSQKANIDTPTEASVLSEATARPWVACFQTLGSDKVGFHIAGHPYGSTRPICSANLLERHAPEMAANAALIVRAVNNFDALVKALEGMVDQFGGLGVSPAVKSARSALEAARSNP